jgi:hypothetical protein
MSPAVYNSLIFSKILLSKKCETVHSIKYGKGEEKLQPEITHFSNL